MKQAFLLLIILIATNYFAGAQTKSPAKIDTARTRSIDDSTHAKFPLQPSATKLDLIDSTDLVQMSNSPLRKYGYIDTADLKLASCSFEKDANAEVLFDYAIMTLGFDEVIMERHKRIKIFNDNGKDEANVKIELKKTFGDERILYVEGQTMTLNDGKIEYTKLDPKLVYIEHTDKINDELVFTMPNVKVGSVFEYRYELARPIYGNFPGWDFQGDLPTRYSELEVLLNPRLSFSVLVKKDKKLDKDSTTINGLGHVWALSEIPSTPDEPFMRSTSDILQNLTFVVSSVRVNGKDQPFAKTWNDAGNLITGDAGIMKPLYQSLHDEDDLIKQAKALPGDDKKISFLFNQVKTLMKWNDDDNWMSRDGIKRAWKKKSGNWGEINMILNRLLNQSGIKAYPMLVSTRDNGKLQPDFTNVFQINKLVDYVPVDSAHYYVLDASDKYNTYNEIPFDILNSYGLVLNKEKKKYDFVYLKKDAPVREVVYINADIKPDGTMKGLAQISSVSYDKSTTLELYKKLDETKYKELLTDNDNNLKITGLKIENAETDSLPLIQNIDFTMNLPGADEKYIYFNPNLFTSLRTNPFISKNRISDIDFGCSNIYTINGRYKIPDGFKIDALPKSMNLVMPDKGITFKRVIGEDNGYIVVNYVIDYKKSMYPQSMYPDVYAYFQKMTDVLNEQIVLKK